MKIACDLDDCLVGTRGEVLKLVNMKLGTNYMYEQVSTFGLEDTFGLSSNTIVPLVDEVLMRESIPHFQYAIDTLNDLYEKGIWDEFYILTNRSLKRRDNTIKLVRSLGLNFPYRLDLVNKDENGIPAKGEFVQHYKVDVLIEDRFDTAVDVAKKTNTEVLLINKPWNMKAIPKESFGQIIRFDTWDEIGQYIIALIGILLEKVNAKAK
jgi:hypothetical protein